MGERETTSVGNDDGTDSIEKDILVKAKNIRIICINKKENRYRVVFTPNESFDKAYIEIEKISETNNETMPLNIVSAVDSSLTVVKNTISFFQLQYGITNVIDFIIEDKEYSTMGVKIHAYKK